MSHSLTNVNDGKLIDVISQAHARLLYMAPGVSDEVAVALGRAIERLGPDRVQVILDADAEVCRLGYGTLTGLETIRKAAQERSSLVCHQAGLRVGLLVSDETTLIYSPTPLLIEAGSRQPERPSEGGTEGGRKFLLRFQIPQ